MKINTIANNAYCKSESETSMSKAFDTYKAAYRTATKTDSVEISSEAYEAYADNEELTATSGKDSLGITKGSKENSFVVHFSDSAMVSRAVSRGYITVNGTKIELPDDTKKQLMKIDKQAQADREKAYGEFVMKHETAVAQQQAASYKKMAEGITRAMEIAAKLARGGKVSPSEEQELLAFNPQIYAMSKNAGIDAKKEGKHSVEAIRKPEPKQEPAPSTEDSDWSSFEWKSYETTLTVSLSDTVHIEDVSEGELDINI